MRRAIVNEQSDRDDCHATVSRILCDALTRRTGRIASDVLRRSYQHLSPSGTGKAAARSRVTFRTLLTALPPLAPALVGLAMFSGLRRGELFALRWKDIDEQARTLTVREAVSNATFGTPKTVAGCRQIPISDTSLRLVVESRAQARHAEPEALVFGTRLGTPISPNNVLRRSIFPACKEPGVPHATWLTFRRTDSSWSHDKGVREGGRAADGSRQRGHDVERVHAGARRVRA